MQNDQIYSELVSFVKTKDDFGLINDQLDLLEAGIYETKGNTFDFVLKNKLPDSFSKLILKLTEFESKEDVIKKIRERLSDVKFLELTLAIQPTQKFIEKMTDWISKSSTLNIALSIKIDQSIIGGALIEFEGKYFDGSVRSKLERILKDYV